MNSFGDYFWKLQDFCVYTSFDGLYQFLKFSLILKNNENKF